MKPPDPAHPRFADWLALQQLRETPELIARAAAMRPGDELAAQKQLRHEWPEALVRGAFALVEARRRGALKFRLADQMWFERVGLEQATPEAVARHKARRFLGEVNDLCCGIGGDAIAQGVNCRVRGFDLDPLNCQRTEWNAAVYGVADNVSTQMADVIELDWSGLLVHLDPDRRKSGQKAVRLEDYVPGPEFLEKLFRTARGGAIKLSPAANFVGRFPEAEIELISLNGECKEATVWFGELRGADPWRATVLPEGVSVSGNPLEHVADLGEAQGWLFDPDPAVVRSGLVDLTANMLGLKRLDTREEYLVGDSAADSPFVQGFEILSVLPNNPGEIRNYFRTSNIGQVEIKCRHVPIQAEEVRRKLPLPGKEAATLIFARVAGRTRAIVCRRIPRHTTYGEAVTTNR